MRHDDFESVVDYTTVLSNFEGPLDLLLYLINREEIAIEDIFVSQVTEQFLDYMQGLPYLDVDKVSDYLNIAATILKIKAQSLVPNFDEEEPEDIEDDKAELIRALEEYRLIKEETKKLKEMETVGYYYKAPDKDVGEVRTVFTLDHVTSDDLIKVFTRLMIDRAKHSKEQFLREIPRDPFTVEQKIGVILESLEERKQVAFEELFTHDFNRSEVITTFQAMLELLKHQYLTVEQAVEFGPILISLNPDRKEDGLGQIDDYD